MWLEPVLTVLCHKLIWTCTPHRSFSHHHDHGSFLLKSWHASLPNKDTKLQKCHDIIECTNLPLPHAMQATRLPPQYQATQRRPWKIAISHAVPVCQATAWTEKAILRRTHGTSPKFYLTIQLCKIKPIVVTDIRDISTTRETTLCWNCAATTKLPSIYPIVYKCYGTIPHRITWLVANTAHKPAMGNNVPASSTWDGSM